MERNELIIALAAKDTPLLKAAMKLNMSAEELIKLLHEEYQRLYNEARKSHMEKIGRLSLN